MTNKDLIYGGIGAAAVVIASIALSKVSRLCKRLNSSLDEIEARTTISVSDDIVDGIVERVAERTFNKVIPAKVEKTVEAVKKDACQAIENDIHEKVKAASPEIEATLKKRLGEVNIDKAKEKVILEAVASATKRAQHDISSEVYEAISQIHEKRDELKSDMEDEIKDSVRDLKRELEDDIKERFEEELDNLTAKYKGRLDDMSTIYSSIANKMKI